MHAAIALAITIAVVRHTKCTGLTGDKSGLPDTAGCVHRGRTTDESCVELGSATLITRSRLLLSCAHQPLAQGTIILFGLAQAVMRDTSAADDSKDDELTLRHLWTIPSGSRAFAWSDIANRSLAMGTPFAHLWRAGNRGFSRTGRSPPVLFVTALPGLAALVAQPIPPASGLAVHSATPRR